MNYILKVAGQQYIVQKGEKRFVPHLDGKVGYQVELESAILATFSGSDISVTTQTPKKAIVKIENQIKGDKVIAFKKKRRKGFMKKKGHRTHYTQISLQSVI